MKQDSKNSKKSPPSPSLSTKEKEQPTSETVLSSNPEDFIILKPSTTENSIREVSIIQNKQSKLSNNKRNQIESESAEKLLDKKLAKED